MGRIALFRRVFLASRWVRERLSASGAVLAGLAAFAAAFGIDTKSNLAHAVFAFAVGFLLVDAAALALVRRRAPRLAAQRFLPRFVTAGVAAAYRIRLENVGARASPPLRVVERLRQGWPEAGALAGATGAAGRFDRRVGYPAFLDLLKRLRVVDVAPLAVPPLRPGQHVELPSPIDPLARGLAAFDELCLVLTGPLGLVETRLRVSAPVDRLPVLPTRLAVAVPPATSQRQWQPGGVHLAQRVGDAEEFRSLRDYRPGDPLRAIHWRSFARTGKPVVREFQEEFFNRQALVLDTAAPYPLAADFELAVSVAAWLVARPREADSMLDLMFVGDRVHRLTAGRGLGGSDGLLRVLATLAPTPATEIEALLASLERHAPQLSSLIVIFLAWDAVRRDAIERLLARGLHPHVIVVDQRTSEDDVVEARFAGIVHRLPAAVSAGGTA